MIFALSWLEAMLTLSAVCCDRTGRTHAQIFEIQEGELTLSRQPRRGDWAHMTMRTLISGSVGSI